MFRRHLEWRDFYVWQILRKHRRGRRDTESLKPVPRMQREDCRFDFLLPEPPVQYEIYLALAGLRHAVAALDWHCDETVKNLPLLSDSQLQGRLEILGVFKNRLPSHKLLQLLPLCVDAFVKHLVVTTLVSAIVINENTSTTILHAQPIALYESLPPRSPDTDGNVSPRFLSKLLLPLLSSPRVESYCGPLP